MTVQWLTTAPNPDPSVYHGGYDQGQRGWRLHAIEAEDSETFPEVRSRRAACGLLPSHGWDLDLFIDQDAKCVRCWRALGLPETERQRDRRETRARLREEFRRERRATNESRSA